MLLILWSALLGPPFVKTRRKLGNKRGTANISEVFINYVLQHIILFSFVESAV